MAFHQVFTADTSIGAVQAPHFSAQLGQLSDMKNLLDTGMEDVRMPSERRMICFSSSPLPWAGVQAFWEFGKSWTLGVG